MNGESELLKKWTLHASVPSNFNSVVWRRIEERRRVSLREAIRQWLTESFARPSVAVAYLSLTVAAALVTAEVQSSKVLRERAGQLEVRYVQSVDPYALHLTK